MHNKVLATGAKRILNGTVHIRDNFDGSLSIDRIEVDIGERNKGEVTRILKILVDAAGKDKISLSAQIAPDSRNHSIKEGLRRAFSRAGFKSLEMDGEIYPNDVEFIPK